MDAVAAQFGGKVRPVIENGGRAVALHDGPQAHQQAQPLIVVGNAFEAQLERRDIAALEERFSARRKNPSGAMRGGETG